MQVQWVKRPRTQPFWVKFTVWCGVGLAAGFLLSHPILQSPPNGGVWAAQFKNHEDISLIVKGSKMIAQSPSVWRVCSSISEQPAENQS